MTILAMLLFALFQEIPAAMPVNTGPPDPATVIRSFYAQKDWEPTADPATPEWAAVQQFAVTASKDTFGKPVNKLATEIRSRWTHKYLYLLFTCPYDELNRKKDPVTDEQTNKLWNWDVAEAFIGSDYLKTSHYKEFQVSPQSEYVDLDIDLSDPKAKGIDWDSGMTVKGRIDADKKIWYGEMRIPFQSLDVKQAKAGDELRIGLYRISGVDPNRVYIAWRPTGAGTFHVPDAFGSLVLVKEPPEKPMPEKSPPEKSQSEKAVSEKPAADKTVSEKAVAERPDDKREDKKDDKKEDKK